MTKFVKHYIEVGDLVAFTITCKHCSASLSLPMQIDAASSFPNKCPSCSNVWLPAQPKNYTSKDYLKEIAEGIEKLRNEILRLSKEAYPPFTLALEVSGLEVSGPASPAKD